MSVTVADVLAAAGAGSGDTAVVTKILAEAEGHVDRYIARALISADAPVPTALRDASVLVCASDLFARYKAPFGQQAMPDQNGNPVPTRLGTDPLGGVRPRLRGYCMEIGFAFPEDDDS